MKIEQSNVAMGATRQASQFIASSVEVEAAHWSNGNTTQGSTAKASALKVSGWAERSAELNLSEHWKQLQENSQKISNKYAKSLPDEPEEDFKIKMLRRLLENLRAMQEGRQPDYEKLEKTANRSLKLQAGTNSNFNFSFAALQGTVTSGSRVMAGGSGHWEEKVTMSQIFTDREVTCFSTAGCVKTADGREIDFNLNLEMSREFTEVVGSTEYIRKTFCVDPLVINLDSQPATFSDQTFFFDLDADGDEEEISRLAAGSGFLALDKNNDGTINDGNELFGPKSGDGFKDLAAYDEDGNGWIDESDSVFKNLKIWTMDDDGKERLIGIGAAGIGAIYLGKTSTQFSVNDMATNETQGIIRSTGVYLKENGEAGTIQHVDLIV